MPAVDRIGRWGVHACLSACARLWRTSSACRRNRFAPDSSPDNIESWDSLQHLNLVLALEQEFRTQFTPEEIEQLLSVELIAALVEEKVKVTA